MIDPGKSGRDSGSDSAGERERGVAALAEEVIRRLASSRPSEADARRKQRLLDIFCEMLTTGDGDRAAQFVSQLRAGGVGYDALHLDWIAPAVRQLGKGWTDDTLSFAAVSLASSRLHLILRSLGREQNRPQEPGLTPSAEGLRLLIAIPDGESHTLGIEIFANLVRHHGWDAELSLAETAQALVARLEARACDVVVLVRYDSAADMDLRALIARLREDLPTRTRIALAAGSPPGPCEAAVAAADAHLPDFETAIDRLARLFSRRS